MSCHEISSETEIWQKSECPACAASNWILMLSDMEACKCWNCQETFWISEKIYDDYKLSLVMAEVFNLTAYEEYIFNGMENPD